MRIGILGAGNVGAVLARKLTASGHVIKLANSKAPEAIEDLAREIGAVAVTKNEAVEDVDVVILSIPFAKVPELRTTFRKVPAGAVIVDTTNYFPYRDGKIAQIEEGKPESVWVSEQIGLQVVKAWNSLMAATLENGGVLEGGVRRRAVPLAGDGARGKQITSQLISATGFDPVDAGGLAESWRLQPGSPAYCTELDREHLLVALAAADRNRSPENRETLIREISSLGGNLTHDEITAMARAVTA